MWYARNEVSSLGTQNIVLLALIELSEAVSLWKTWPIYHLFLEVALLFNIDIPSIQRAKL
jgi:hypothetical protein